MGNIFLSIFLVVVLSTVTAKLVYTNLPTKLATNKVNETNPDILSVLKEDWRGHNVTLRQVYINSQDKVAIFFDPKLSESLTGKNTSHDQNSWFTSNPHWIFNFTPKVWSYMKRTYGNFGPDPYLYLVVHPLNSHTLFHSYSVNKNRKNLLDISSLGLTSTEGPVNKDMDTLTNKLAYFVSHSSKNRQRDPSRYIWGVSSHPAWEDIFTYDVYTNLNLIAEAKLYKANIRKNHGNNLRGFWFLDWFLPIYTNDAPTNVNHRGNKVLNEFFELLGANLKFYKVWYEHSLTTGEFVHFWSGAAKTNLRQLATELEVFGWNETLDRELAEAKIAFPNVSILYMGYYSNDITVKPKREKATFTLIQNLTPLPNIRNVTTENDTFNIFNLDLNIIIGIGVAVSVILTLIITLIASFILHKRKIHNLLQTEIRTLTSVEVKNFFEGDGNLKSDEAQALVLSMPFIKDFEIPKERIVLDLNSILGSGEYGTVYHGLIQLNENNEPTEAAIKTVKPNVEIVYFKAFLSEVKIMAYLGKHDNIVGLLGTCTKNIKSLEISIALELCPLGSLENYLKKNRENFYILETTSHHDHVNKMTVLDLVKWSQEISKAMMYLTVKKVIHGDLAARNVLLTENRTAKISDFGLSRQFLNYANYMKTSTLPVPWRWLSIEALKDMKFSTASDVWAFGVTMWEIFSLAEIPYGAWTYDLFFVDRLIAGDRLLSPTHANEPIYEIMKDCWKIESSERPTFEQICDRLGEVRTLPLEDQVQVVPREAGRTRQNVSSFLC